MHNLYFENYYAMTGSHAPPSEIIINVIIIITNLNKLALLLLPVLALWCGFLHFCVVCQRVVAVPRSCCSTAMRWYNQCKTLFSLSVLLSKVQYFLSLLHRWHTVTPPIEPPDNNNIVRSLLDCLDEVKLWMAKKRGLIWPIWYSWSLRASGT